MPADHEKPTSSISPKFAGFLGVVKPGHRAAPQAKRVRKDRIVSEAASLKAAQAAEEVETGTHRADASLLNFSLNSRAAVALDDNQLRAVDLFMTNSYAILGGYAGTGKTTTMQAVIAAKAERARLIDWLGYRSVGMKMGGEMRPAIGLLCCTNMAARNLASKLPEEWADHCMSIHSALAYAPTGTGECYENGREKTIFAPRYHASNPLPLTDIFIDEAGQMDVQLWHNLLEAAPHCNIYFLGDMAQLRPSRGHSPMTYAMVKWPSMILDKVYRQKEGGILLDNITRIRRGLLPVHDKDRFRCDKQENLVSSPSKAVRQIEGYIGFLFRNGVFDPMQDIILTPENGADLGCDYWNMRFRTHFNPARYEPGTKKLLNPAVRIRTADGIAIYSVGDKVMATGNGGRLATERRFVNGSLGVVVEIRPNPDYRGDLQGVMDGEDIFSLSLEDALEGDEVSLSDDQARNDLAELMNEDTEDEIKRRAASHVVVVRELVTGEIFELTSSAEIKDLQCGYATTAHRFQGSQARHVVIICHPSMHKVGLWREWLYTAASRAKERVFLLSHPDALHKAITRQQLPGANPLEKARLLVEAYRDRQWLVPQIPEAAEI